MEDSLSISMNTFQQHFEDSRKTLHDFMKGSFFKFVTFLNFNLILI